MFSWGDQILSRHQILKEINEILKEIILSSHNPPLLSPPHPQKTTDLEMKLYI